jgi:hypothetical protein
MNVSTPLKQRLVSESDKLIRMYHDDMLSLTDIGELYGCSRQYVQLIFKELGIERRPRILALQSKPRHRKSKYDFAEADDKFIRDNHQEMTDIEMGRELSKPPKAITYRRLIILGCKKIARRNFTVDENKFILDNYKKLTDTAIAKIMNRSLISVTHHRNRILNKPKRIIKNYSPEDDNFIVGNYKNMTDGQIAIALKRSKASVAVHRNEVLRLGKTKNRGEENNPDNQR